MKSYSTLIQEFSTRQRKGLEALFIVLDWTRNYHRTHPNIPVGQEWLNAAELTIRIIYDDALSAMKNQGIAFHSGSDTTEAPPEVISSIMEELSKNNSSPFIKIESPNYYYFGKPSTSSESNDSSNDMVNFMYFGPAYRIAENRNSSEDVPFGFQFPHSMHFNFGDRRQGTSINLNNSTSSLSCQSGQALSGVTLSESEQKEMFLPFPAMYLVRPTKDEKNTVQVQGSIKPEGSEIFESSQMDLTKYVDPTLDSQNSNPAIEFFRISSGIIPAPKNSDIAKRQCTSPFCLCSIVKAACQNEANDDSVEEEYDMSEEVSIEPYLEVENVNFPKLELPDLLEDTPESFMLMQPFNTPNNREDLETCNRSEKDTSFPSLIIPGTPRNIPEDRELLIQSFNTPVATNNISESSNMDTSLNDSLGVAELGLDKDIADILQSKCSLDNDHEYIRQERLRILFSYEKSRLSEQNKTDGNDEERNDKLNFASSSPNWRYCESREDKSENGDC